MKLPNELPKICEIILIFTYIKVSAYSRCQENREDQDEWYVLISDFFTWINPNIIPTMAQEALDNVQAEIAKTEAIINS